MTSTYDSIYYKEYKIKIVQDYDYLDPCQEWDMLGTQVHWHKRMNLGHEFKATSHMSPTEWLINQVEHIRDMSDDEAEILRHNPIKAMQEFEKYNLVIPVFAYEHGGITIKASKTGIGWDSWDSGQLGFIYVSYEKIKKEYKIKRLTKKALENATSCLLAEVEVYDDYLTGNVWGYQVVNDKDEILDSCYGFYGDDGREEAENQGRQYIDWQIQEDEKELSLYDQRMTLGYTEA